MTNDIKIEALVKFLGYEGEEIEDVQETIYDDCEFKTPEGDFLVMTDEEADDRAVEIVKSFIDDYGINGFTLNFQEEIYNNYADLSWFDEAMEESYELYCDDIENENCDEDEEGNETNRLTEEMEEAGCETKEDYIEYLCEQWEDGAEWYKSNFGEEAFAEAVKNYCSLDEESVAESGIEQDGRAMQLAGYDHEENEIEIEGKTLYIYRTN